MECTITLNVISRRLHCFNTSDSRLGLRLGLGLVYKLVRSFREFSKDAVGELTSSRVDLSAT